MATSKNSESVHILDLYRKSLLLRFPSGEKGDPRSRADYLKVDEEEEHEFIPSVTKLSQVGIGFKQSKTSNLNDISFCRGVLKLPGISVDDTFKSKYLNLMAFEGLHCGAGNEVRFYVYIMCSIMNSAEDVSLLKSCRIIKNVPGSDEVVATLFTSISKDVSVYYCNWLEIALSDYCRKPLPRWVAYANHNYFTNIHCHGLL